MKAMILAAGVGSRLDPLTRNVPKPLVPIVNRPVMEYLINLLKKHGFDEIMINTHYLGSQIEAYFGDGANWGVQIHWAREDKLWGDAGSVKRAESFFKDDTFLVIGGDDLTDMDLTAFLQTHKDKKALSSIALSLVDDPSEYGIVLMNEEDRITRFLEKPKGETIFSNTANTGVYLFEPQVFDYIPADAFFLFGKQVFPLLLEKNLPLYGHLTRAYWKDVGNLQVYQQTHRDVLNGLVKATQPFTELRPGIWVGENVQIAPSAELTPPLAVGDNVAIKAGAQVGDNTILGNGCIVGENATVVDSILWEGAEVMAGTHIERCVVGKECHVQTNAAIFDGIIVPPDRPETVRR